MTLNSIVPTGTSFTLQAAQALALVLHPQLACKPDYHKYYVVTLEYYTSSKFEIVSRNKRAPLSCFSLVLDFDPDPVSFGISLPSTQSPHTYP